MDSYRLAALIWLLLPIPVYWQVRRWYFSQIRKYPATTAGRIVNVSYHLDPFEDVVLFTNVAYAFDVAGAEYKGQATLRGKIHNLGPEIPIRYNPERPEESRLDNLRDWIEFGWVSLGIKLAVDSCLAWALWSP